MPVNGRGEGAWDSDLAPACIKLYAAKRTSRMSIFEVWAKLLRMQLESRKVNQQLQMRMEISNCKSGLEILGKCEMSSREYCHDKNHYVLPTRAAKHDQTYYDKLAWVNIKFEPNPSLSQVAIRVANLAKYKNYKSPKSKTFLSSFKFLVEGPFFPSPPPLYHVVSFW